jgi:UDP-N-acetylmuramate dehydrogenase
MTTMSLPTAKVDALREAFGDELRLNEPFAKYTSARIGGAADFLLVAHTAGQLTQFSQTLWDLDVPFRVIGGGSNILVSDSGVREVMVLNQARDVQFIEGEQSPLLRAESGASLGNVARRAAARGWTGLEWAATVPGTVGGAVVGNAGAYGGDIAHCLEVAEILQPSKGVESWTPERFEYAYRDSWMKRNPGRSIVIAATLRLERASPEETKAKMDAYVAQRQQSQPRGASMGSMFKNPPGDYAGRLIEEAGLKGMQCGNVQISTQHGNYFINLGGATATDVKELIDVARSKVAALFGIELALEVELVGDWKVGLNDAAITSVGGER